jgi:hypothetical protein
MEISYFLKIDSLIHSFKLLGLKIEKELFNLIFFPLFLPLSNRLIFHQKRDKH